MPAVPVGFLGANRYFWIMNHLSGKIALCFLSAALLLAACGPASRQRTVAVLDDVETYINERPDSALAVLTTVDTTSLTTRALRARYSLLRVMALDKCYEDITAPGLLAPAVAWYARHGTADEKMKTLYYQGRIAQDKKHLDAAAVSYAQAETYASKASDAHAKGLLYMAFGSIYNTVYNVNQEQEYAEKAIKVLQESNDSLYGVSLGGLALVYHSRKEWAQADSLYKQAVALSQAFPRSSSILLSNYARMKLLQPDKDPSGAIELLDRKREISGGGLTPEEAGAYAYACELLGKKNTADALFSRLEDMIEKHPLQVLPWLSRIAIARGDYQTAYRYQTEAHSLESKAVQDALSEAVMQSLLEAADRKAEKSRLRTQLIVCMAGVICLVLLSLILIGVLRRRGVEIELTRLVGIREQLQAELEISEVEIAEHKDRIAEMKQKVAQEREMYTRERVRRLRQLGELRSTFWWRERNRMREKDAVEAIKKEIEYVFMMDNDGAVLVRRLDKELDGAISRLRKELHLRGNPREVLFICCCILDLEPELIAEIMNTTKANVYEKRSRIRARIKDLNDPLLSVLVEKSNNPL